MDARTAQPHSGRAQGQTTATRTGADLVLAALAVSAVVSSGAAYVALNYVAQPFIVTPVAAPRVDTRGPFLADTTQPDAVPDLSPVTDVAPTATIAGLSGAPTLGALPPSPVRVVYGAPTWQPDLRPALTDRLFALVPTPRPGTAPAPDFAQLSPPAGAST